MDPIRNIIQLRQLLAERFPSTRKFSEQSSSALSSKVWVAGLSQFDELLPGGFFKGGITELISGGVSSGSALLLRHLLGRSIETNQWMALVDGQDSFDPTALDEQVLSRLLWVRCHDAAEALKASDLLLRDGNLPLVLLDLRLNPAAQLRKIPATTWYRFQHLLEQTSTILFVVTPCPLVNGAQARLSLRGNFSVEALGENSEELLTQLKIDLVQSRLHRQRKTSTSQLKAEAG